MLSFDFVWLASQSPRRKELLARLGVRTQALIADESLDIPEDVEALEQARPGEDPSHYVERVVSAKLAAAQARLLRRGWPAAPILVADTTVAIGGQILGKPANALEATATLQALSGRTHRVLTAVAVARPGHDKILRATSVSRVRFARLTQRQIERYVATGEPMDKAGAYGLQGSAGAFVREIRGSDSGVIGLPLYETARLLQSAGVLER